MRQYYPRFDRRFHRTAVALLAVGVGLGVGFAALPAMGQSVSWGDLFKWLAPQRRSGASRDGSVCILSMDQQPPAINPSASRTPTLVWQGTARKVGLRRLGEERDFWQRDRKLNLSGIQQMRYAGALLEPGESYTWVVYGNYDKQTKADFKILSTAEQAELTTALAAQTDLTQRLPIYEAKGLRSDAWGELTKTRNLPLELKQAMAAAPAQICPKSEPIKPQ